MNKSISVILPFYNNSKTIERCLKSIDSQSIKPLEVIIIDDGSKDWLSANQIIKKFSSLPLLLLKHKVNRNGAAARNTGIKAATGEYIAFLDADDEWLPYHLEYSVDKIEFEESDISYSQAQVFSRNGLSVMPKNGLISSQTISDYLFVQGAVMFTPSLLVRTKLAKTVLFNEKLIRHQDYDFLLRFEALGTKITFIDRPTVIVHWENNNPKAKGGTWDFSLKFALDYKEYFSAKAFSRFILKNCILPLLEEKKRMVALNLFLRHINLKHFSKYDYYFVLSYLIFGKFKHPYKWKK